MQGAGGGSVSNEFKLCQFFPYQITPEEQGALDRADEHRDIDEHDRLAQCQGLTVSDGMTEQRHGVSGIKNRRA